MGLVLEAFRIDRGGLRLVGEQLHVASGELVALVGPSGAGKTTILETLLGRWPLAAGQLRLRDEHASGRDERWFARQRRQQLASLTQGTDLFAALSAIDNAALAALLAGQPATTARAEAARLLDALGLRAAAARPAQQLSRGERQRVALARAFLHPGWCVLLDEPTTALDADARAAVVALLQERAQRGGAVLVATHDADITAAAQRVYRIRDSAVVDASD